MSIISYSIINQVILRLEYSEIFRIKQLSESNTFNLSNKKQGPKPLFKICILNNSEN